MRTGNLVAERDAELPAKFAGGHLHRAAFYNRGALLKALYSHKKIQSTPKRNGVQIGGARSVGCQDPVCKNVDVRHPCPDIAAKMHSEPSDTRTTHLGP